MNTLKHIVLIGVGLIGGSFVLDLKRLGLADTVTGIDLDRDNLDRAPERRGIDRAHTRPESAYGCGLAPRAAPRLSRRPAHFSLPPPSPRSVALRAEIGPLPHRDRSYSASKSVQFRIANVVCQNI